MPEGVGVARRTVITLTAVVAMSGCSSSGSTSVEPTPASAVALAAPSLVGIASPGGAWARASIAEIGSILAGAPVQAASAVAAPVAVVRDRDGQVTDAISGWTSTVVPSSVAGTCEQLQHWVATGETTYGLVVPAGTTDGFCVPVLRAAMDGAEPGPAPLVAACAPAVPAEPTTCIHIDAVPVERGVARVYATVSLQS